MTDSKEQKLVAVLKTTDPALLPIAKSVLEAAFAEATQMKDEYVSIEHIFLAIADEKQGAAAAILSRACAGPQASRWDLT